MAGGSVVLAVRACLDELGSIGVIVPDAMLAAPITELTVAGIEAQPLGDDADPRVTVVPAGDAKGLEFDSVVLLEPAAIVAAEASRLDGLRRLYVVLTRAVSRLRIVHSDPLPVELG